MPQPATEFALTQPPTTPPVLPAHIPLPHGHRNRNRAFAETPIRPFDADHFFLYLSRVRDSYRSFNDEMQQFIHNNKPLDCGTFNGWTALWVLEALGYIVTPPHWRPICVEYRGLLRDAVSLTTERRPLCSAYGGQVSAETTQAILDFVTWAYPRSEAMIIEAAQLTP